jgi:hypothetical protein
MMMKLKTPVITLVTGVFLFAFSLVGCSTDSKHLKASRDAFLKDDFNTAELSLYSQEVFKQSENRFVHYSSLASIAMSAGQYEKAIYFLLRSRDLVNGLRSSHSGFSWFSHDYLSNGIEYSYLHYFLVMAHYLLAQDGQTAAWTTPEIKDKDGNILIAAQSFPAKKYTAREIADLKRKANAEILAWDTHLQNLKSSNTDLSYYRNDLWARLLASYVHSLSDQNNEKRTSELLANDALKLLHSDFKMYPSATAHEAQIESLIQKLKQRDRKQSLLVVEAGVMSKYKIKRFHLGLSTLFKGIKDPFLRSQLEQIGIRVILEFAPEFGLTLFAGAVAGAISGSVNEEDTDYEGPPRQFTDAVDESFGFLIQFPSLQLPPSDTKVSLQLSSKDRVLAPIALPVVSPLQEILATELKNREDHEMFKESFKIGLQYLAVLIPAIRTYQAAAREGSFFKKLAAIGGYYMAKKLIDNAHRPDIRSWNFLPKLVAADLIAVPPGTYQAKISIDNALGKTERLLGELKLGDPLRPMIRHRIGDIPNLKTPLPQH